MGIRTIGALERLEHLDQLGCAKDIRVFGSNLHNNSEILLLVDTEHLLQACHGVLNGQLTKEIDEPVRVK